MSRRDGTPKHPAHADVWLRMPGWTLGVQRGLISAAIVAAGLLTLAGASGAAHRVGAAPAAPSTGSSGTSSSPSWSSATPWSTAPAPLGTAYPTSGVPTAAPFFPPPTGYVPSSGGLPSGSAVNSLAADGIPTVALDAYRRAAAESVTKYPGCGLPWPLLAAIGRVESDHGRFANSQIYANGTTAPRIVGIPLNGVGTALIRDTDGGRLDGDKVYDRAVGPMQFIPSTWAHWGVDGNGDGVIDPSNIYDAATAAANYLCAAGGNLQTAAGQIRAVLTYNDSDAYLSTVLALEKVYAAGAPGVSVPVTGPHPAPAPGEKPTLPPVDPGPPLAATHPKSSPGNVQVPPSAGHPTTHSVPPGSSPGSGGSSSGTGTPTPTCPTTTPPSSGSGTPSTPASTPDSAAASGGSAAGSSSGSTAGSSSGSTSGQSPADGGTTSGSTTPPPTCPTA